MSSALATDSSLTHDTMDTVLYNVDGLDLVNDDDGSPSSSYFDGEILLSDDEELIPPAHTISYEHNTDIFAAAFQQSLTDGVDSPNDMQVDTDDLLADADNEKDDVAIINQDSENEPKPRADDCKSLASA